MLDFEFENNMQIFLLLYYNNIHIFLLLYYGSHLCFISSAFRYSDVYKETFFGYIVILFQGWIFCVLTVPKERFNKIDRFTRISGVFNFFLGLFITIFALVYELYSKDNSIYNVVLLTMPIFIFFVYSICCRHSDIYRKHRRQWVMIFLGYFWVAFMIPRETFKELDILTLLSWLLTYLIQFFWIFFWTLNAVLQYILKSQQGAGVSEGGKTNNQNVLDKRASFECSFE